MVQTEAGTALDPVFFDPSAFPLAGACGLIPRDMSEGFVHGSTQFAANEDRRVSPARAPVAACGIAVMAKASTDGRAKTRLAPPLSYREAAAFNSDSPTLPTSRLVETANVLAQPGDRAVLGPASDGGYYLLGLKQAHPHIFDDIAWSTSRVAEETLARAREIGLDVHVLAPW